MTTNLKSAHAMPAFLSQGFRPFFLATGLWSAIALAVWIVMFTTGTTVPSRFDPLAWHIHEMLFGFVMAAIAGFLLTAIPNWTGRLPVSGSPLALLAGLWLLGRIACLLSALVPAWIAIAADLSFPVLLVGVVAREIVVGRNWRNLPMVAPVGVLGIANLLMHLEADGVAVPSGLGWRLGLATVIVLISVMAGRIVPSFTRNWLAKRPGSELPGGHGWVDKLALGVLHAGLIGWAFLPGFGRSDFCFWSARRSISGACCAGAGSQRPRSRCCLFSMSAMLGLCLVSRCSAWPCSVQTCRSVRPSTH